MAVCHFQRGDRGGRPQDLSSTFGLRMKDHKNYSSSLVSIDARWLHLGGLGTYTYNLVSRFSRYANGLTLRGIVKRQAVQEIESFCDEVAICDASMYSLREQLEIPRAARDAGVFHSLHYNAPLLYRGPQVVSILDLIHITDPTYRRGFRSWGYARPMLNLTAKKAKHIITISEYSKKQIVEVLGVPGSKVSVIYCGANPEFRYCVGETAREMVHRRLGLDGPYILYVGNLKPHKNVSTLFRAVAGLRKRRTMPHKLLIVGDDARWGPARREECYRLGIGDITQFVQHVPRDLLPIIYGGADLLVMPSTIEGFGLPVLEAMACGTPVICSRAASLPEVGGDAVVYFDPLSSGELAAAIERVLDSGSLQEILRTSGMKRAGLFDWNECVHRHADLYRQVLGSN